MLIWLICLYNLSDMLIMYGIRAAVLLCIWYIKNPHGLDHLTASRPARLPNTAPDVSPLPPG